MLITPSSLLQVVNSLFQTCCNKLGTSSASTTCWQLVNRCVTTCLQTCYKLCVFTRAVSSLLFSTYWWFLAEQFPGSQIWRTRTQREALLKQNNITLSRSRSAEQVNYALLTQWSVHVSLISVTEVWFLQYAVVSLQFHLSHMWEGRFQFDSTKHRFFSPVCSSCNVTYWMYKRRPLISHSEVDEWTGDEC
jgi:hypothetical protein